MQSSRIGIMKVNWLHVSIDFYFIQHMLPYPIKLSYNLYLFNIRTALADPYILRNIYSNENNHPSIFLKRE